MTRLEWIALAKRCEEATGPDRDISEAIMSGLGYKRYSDEHWFCEGKGHFNVANQITAYIDTITALVGREFPNSFASAAVAGYSSPWAKIAKKGMAGEILAYGDTPALALCAAFCRAKAEREEA